MVEADITAAQFAAVVELSVDTIITKTIDGVVLSWNAAAERLFGYGAAEMIGRSMTHLYPPELVEEEDASLNASVGANASSATKPCA